MIGMMNIIGNFLYTASSMLVVEPVLAMSDKVAIVAKPFDTEPIFGWIKTPEKRFTPFVEGEKVLLGVRSWLRTVMTSLERCGYYYMLPYLDDDFHSHSQF